MKLGSIQQKPAKDQSLVDELDLLSLSFEPQESDNSIKSSDSATSIHNFSSSRSS